MSNPQLLAYRIALIGLIKFVERLCDEFCLKPERHQEYNQAKELLSATQTKTNAERNNQGERESTQVDVSHGR